MARVKKLYLEKIEKELAEELGISNKNAIPKIVKVVVNVGVGRAVQDSKYLKEAEEALEAITGQKPVQTVSKKSIAGFKIREKNPIGVSVTLRGNIMYEFIDRLVGVALPRVRDFRGIKRTAFDGKGNYSVGIKEHTVFPELINKEVSPISFQVNIETTAKTNTEGLALLKKIGFPFKAEE